jgi:hypothetical protein
MNISIVANYVEIACPSGLLFCRQRDLAAQLYLV